MTKATDLCLRSGHNYVLEWETNNVKRLEYYKFKYIIQDGEFLFENEKGMECILYWFDGFMTTSTGDQVTIKNSISAILNKMAEIKI